MLFSFRRLLVVAILLLTACDPGVEPVLVGSITIGPVDSELDVGSTAQLSATVQSTTGSVMSGHPVSWSSTAPSVASVTASGLVSAHAPGAARIRASSEGKSASVELTVAAGPCTQATAGSISTGQTRTGTIDRTDCTLNYGRAEGWSFTRASAGGVRIVMAATGFYPELMLTDRHLNVVLWPDWHSEGVQLLGDLPAGEYIVWAASYEESASGTYQISARDVEFCSEAAATTTIGAGSTEAGTLGPSDCVFEHGVSADGFRMTVLTSTGLSVELSSTAFDALLVITDGDMNVLWWDDDGGESDDARIERRFTAGEYLVWTTGYFSDASGVYELTVTDVEIPLCPLVGELELGQAASGTLATDDCPNDRGYSDPWRLSLAAETTVRIDLTSTQFDAFLIVEDEHGGMIAWNDDFEGLDSRLEYTFPAGEYRVVATSWGYRETGAYELTTQVVAGAAVTTELAPTTPQPWLKGAKTP